MRQNIFMVGAPGKVGRRQVNQVASKDHPMLRRHPNPTVIAGMASTSEYAFDTERLDPQALEAFAKTRQRISNYVPVVNQKSLDDIIDEGLGRGWGEDLIYVDTTAGLDELRDFHLNVLRETRSRIATANKNPIAMYDMATYLELTRDPTRYSCRATTMAGLGPVPWIRERADIGDNIQSIKASLSGTLGFICWRLQNGAKLSQAIREAMEAGYTEPDFRDDLNGLDVARKLIILAREAGFYVEMKDVKINGFLPQEYFDIEDPEECLRQIEAKLDEEYAEKFESAKPEGTFRHLATLERQDSNPPKMEVGLQEVALDDAFGKLTKTSNYLEAVTDMYDKDDPYKVGGPGAGLDVTASVVRVDLLNMQPHIDRHIRSRR